MKLITFPLAPNGKRVEMFIAEKENCDIETRYIEMNEAALESLKDLNPLKQVPTLEIESGRGLSESTTICSYIESQYPAHNLLGTNDLEKATIDMWQRRMELGFFIPIVEYGHHTHPFFKDSIKQISEFGPFHNTKVMATITILEETLSNRSYIAGDRFTIADITAYSGLQLALVFEMFKLESPALIEWAKTIDQRKSAKFAQYSL